MRPSAAKEKSNERIKWSREKTSNFSPPHPIIGGWSNSCRRIAQPSWRGEARSCRIVRHKKVWEVAKKYLSTHCGGIPLEQDAPKAAACIKGMVPDAANARGKRYAGKIAATIERLRVYCDNGNRDNYACYAAAIIKCIKPDSGNWLSINSSRNTQ